MLQSMNSDETGVQEDVKYQENATENIATQENLEMLPAENQKKKLHWGIIIVLALVSLILIGLGAGYYYISNIDWNQHKDKIAAEFSEFTGKKIVFEGPVHLTLFPAPKLQAEDIKIYNPGENADEPLAQIKSLFADLTLNSLLNGDFDVRMMSLQDPVIRLELLENDKLNWDTPLSDAQLSKLENMQITLDSVLIKNAQLNFLDNKRNINYTLNNINAEVIAQSIFGPYRIEGTYIKDNNPEGFAFSIGKITSGLSTSINAVINQPGTETFVRFDGSVMPQNDAINGNLIFESKKLMDFINSNTDTFKLKSDYDYPLAIAFELKSNKTKLEISNFVAKYGETAGAGNLLIPLPRDNASNQEKNIRPKVEFGFNFTNIDLNPIEKLLLEFWNKYKNGKTPYNPQLNFDLLADINAVKAVYNNQSVKDLKLSFDIFDNKITVRNLDAVLPGDSSFSVNGDIYSELGYLTFKLHPILKTNEFRQLLSWLNFDVELKDSTFLRRVNFDTQLAGNFNKVSIAPFKLSLDNTTMEGEAGIINDEKFNMFLALKLDTINLDNYLPVATEQENVSWAEKLDAKFKNLKELNDLYAELKLKADSIMLNGLTASGVNFDGGLQNGKMQLKKFDVVDFAGAKLNLKGNLAGFGDRFEMQNLKFDVNAPNFTDFAQKISLNLGLYNLQKIKKFEAKGIVTGYTNYLATKTITNLNNSEFTYSGRLEKKNEIWNFAGNLEVKNSDFVQMLNDFNFEYAPRTYILGLFNLKTKLEGSPQTFSMSDTRFNIGSNTFEGSIDFDAQQPRKSIEADLTVDRFELDKFFYNNPKIKAEENSGFRAQVNQQPDFLDRPFFDVEKFNFDFLRGFDFVGNFNVSRLSYRNFNFDYAQFALQSKENILKLSNFESDFEGGKLLSDFELLMLPERSNIRGHIKLQGYDIAESKFSGMKFGLKSGKLDVDSQFVSIADSFADMYEKLKADGTFALSNAVVKGWNMELIHEDLVNRQDAQGLSAFLLKNLQSGEAKIVSAEGKFAFDEGRLGVSNSLWNGQNYTLNLDANCSLANWDGNIAFKAKYINPDYLPAFTILYNGSLAMPKLTVDNENLSIMYNERQNALKQQQEAAFAAQQAKLRGELDDALLKTKAQKSELDNLVRPDLQLKMSKVQDKDILDAYKNIEGRIEKIEVDIADLMLVGQRTEINEEILKDVAARNSQNAQYIEEIKKDMQQTNIRHMKEAVDQKYKNILEQGHQAKVYMQEYEQKYDELKQKLEAIETSYSLEQDATFSRLTSAFKGNILALEKIIEKVSADYQSLTDAADEAILDKYFRDISSFETDIKKYIQDISQNLKQLFEYASERVKIAVDAYNKKKQEEELKKKVEENTGSISVKGTGVSKTFVQNLDEIKETEKAFETANENEISSSKVQTLEQEVSVIRRSDKKEQKENEAATNLIKRTSGKISKATGVIIKK